jgi:hypothetical protein
MPICYCLRRSNLSETRRKPSPELPPWPVHRSRWGTTVRSR